MRRSTQIFLLVGLVLSCTVSALSRDASWNELMIEVLKFYHVGRYSEAATVAEEALAVAENSFGSSHPNVVESLNLLAILYCAQGEYGKAESLFKRVLTIMEAAYGSDHPSVAACFNNLGQVYREQGKYKEAEVHYRFALEIDERAFGKDHPEVATYLSNLALLYCSKGEYDRAEAHFNRALAIMEKALGRDHPDVATVLENMKECYNQSVKEGAVDKVRKRSRTITKPPIIAKRKRLPIASTKKGEESTIPGFVQDEGMEEKRSEGGIRDEEKSVVPKSSEMILERESSEKVAITSRKELPEAKKITKILVSKREEVVQVTLIADGEIADYNFFKMENPSRLVIEIWNVKNGYPKHLIQVGHPLLKRVRIAAYPKRIRFYFEAVRIRVPQFQIQRAKDRLVVSFGQTGELPAKLQRMK